MVTGATDPNAFDGTLLIGWDGECVHWIALDSNGIADHGVDSEIDSLTELSHRFSGAAAVKLSLLRPVCSCLLYTSPSPRDGLLPRMPSSA